MVDIKKRDDAIDIAKAVLIILMMIGHMNVAGTTRAIIYSFHMAAFVLYSGYCFNTSTSDNLVKCIKNLSKTFLIPYSIWAVFYVVMNDRSFMCKILDILCGMSNSNLIFTERSTVGQVYFLLLLFLVRLLYAFIYRFIKNEFARSLIIVVISLFGVLFGKIGVWLPWSLDCVFLAMVFYHAGVLIKKYDALHNLNKWCYLVLIVLWYISIVQGGMSLFIRDYRNYIIMVLGAVSASLLLYKVASFLNSHLNYKVLQMVIDIGKNTLSILLVHTIFGGYIVIMVINGLMKTGIIESFYINCLIILCVHIVFGLLWGKAYEKVCENWF